MTKVTARGAFNQRESFSKGKVLALIASAASPQLFAELEKASRRVMKRRGEILFRRGEPAAGVFLVVNGSVDLELEGAGTGGAVRRHGVGSIVGLPANLSGNPYSLTAEVAADVTLGFVPRTRLLEILAQSPPLCLEVMQILSDEIAHSRQITENLMISSRQRNRKV